MFWQTADSLNRDPKCYGEEHVKEFLAMDVRSLGEAGVAGQCTLFYQMKGN